MRPKPANNYVRRLLPVNLEIVAVVKRATGNQSIVLLASPDLSCEILQSHCFRACRTTPALGGREEHGNWLR
jgi:hypothetical protein